MSAWKDYIKNIQNRIDGLQHGACAEPLFRGHSCADWKLLPSLARLQSHPRFNVNKEKRLYWDFRMLGGHLLPPDASAWTILYYMQHHGVPTRLFDWTTNFATALFFALSGRPDSPTVWILDPYELNEQSLGKREISNLNVSFKTDYVAFMDMPQKPATPLAVSGDSTIERMRSQGGAFTVHGDLSKPLEELCPRSVSKHVLPPEAIPEAWSFLSLAGTNEFQIFPDLDGLAKYLTRKEFST